MESNFSFIKDIFPKTFERLFEAERSVRTNSEIDARRALEELVTEYVERIDAKWLFDEYGKRIHNRYPDITLEAKLDICTSKKLLADLGYTNLENGVILPKIGGLIRSEYENGKIVELPPYVFLRKYGNAKSHIAQADSIKITYATSVQALLAFHTMLVKIYNNRLGKRPLMKDDFKEPLMPIQGQEHLYFIDEAYVPSDAPMSRCQMEYKAHFTPSGVSKKTEYAIIRQYNKQEAEQMFLLRNNHAMRKANDPMDGLPYCVRSSEVLSGIDNANSPFYIVVYDFQEKPQPLSTELLGTLDMKTRLSLCVDLARGMAEIHERGIYQRLLTYGNVYICDYSARGKGVHPHLVKFDFAKLEQKQGEDGIGTVLPWAIAARNKIEDENIKKYSNEDDWKNERWEKADIYALGILFCDILSGRINKNREQMEYTMGKVFDSQQLSESFVDFLERMIDDIAEDRPSAMEIQRMAEAEMRKWS